jgi:hypothetical protein
VTANRGSRRLEAAFDCFKALSQDLKLNGASVSPSSEHITAAMLVLLIIESYVPA